MRPDLEVDEHHVDNKDEDSSYLEVHPEAGRALKFVGLVSILFFTVPVGYPPIGGTNQVHETGLHHGTSRGGLDRVR